MFLFYHIVLLSYWLAMLSEREILKNNLCSFLKKYGTARDQFTKEM